MIEGHARYVDHIVLLFIEILYIDIGIGTGGATGAMAPSLFGQNYSLKLFLFFLNTILTRQTIHQDEESTKLCRNVS